MDIGLLLVLELQTDQCIGGHDCDLCISLMDGLHCTQHILIAVVLVRLRENGDSGREITLLNLFLTAFFSLFFSSATTATVRLIVPRSGAGTRTGEGTGYVLPRLPTSVFSLFFRSATTATVRLVVPCARAGNLTGAGTAYVAARIDTAVVCVGLRNARSRAHCASLSVCPTLRRTEHCAPWTRSSRRFIGGGVIRMFEGEVSVIMGSFYRGTSGIILRSSYVISRR